MILDNTKIILSFPKEAGLAWAVDLFNKRKAGTINASELVVLGEFEDMFDFWHINLEDEAKKELVKEIPF